MPVPLALALALALAAAGGVGVLACPRWQPAITAAVSVGLAALAHAVVL